MSLGNSQFDQNGKSMREENSSDRRQIEQTGSMGLSGHKCILTIPDQSWHQLICTEEHISQT